MKPQRHLPQSWYTTATDLITLTDASHGVPLSPATLRKHLRAHGVPLVLYRRTYFVSWTDFALWKAEHLDFIKHRARWGKAIHDGRRKATASTTGDTAGGAR